MEVFAAHNLYLGSMFAEDDLQSPVRNERRKRRIQWEIKTKSAIGENGKMFQEAMGTKTVSDLMLNQIQTLHQIQMLMIKCWWLDITSGTSKLFSSR